MTQQLEYAQANMMCFYFFFSKKDTIVGERRWLLGQTDSCKLALEQVERCLVSPAVVAVSVTFCYLGEV